MENIEKIEIIQNRIDNLDVHIFKLQQDILENPEADIEDKPLRRNVLEGFESRKTALLNEISSLTA